MPKKHSPIQGVSAAFRQWTRGTSFTLAMGKTQVATLVSLHADRAREREGWLAWRQHKSLRHFVPAVQGLIDRGLVIHVPPKREMKQLSDLPRMRDCYPLTAAGELVVQLLQLAGIYQELVDEFERFEVAETRRRMAG